ncbi:MAG: hypothetical protein IT320_04615 [Anaerolineae bacterium]|nr:hypothetical protein [Anaerolineae bacterium]
MGRKPKERPSNAGIPLPYVPELEPPVEPTLVERVLLMPRLARMLVAAVFALSAALLVTPVVDNFYMDHFFSMDTRLLPALVSAGVGMVIYVIGWRLLVGVVGETPSARPATRNFLIFGVALLVLVVILVAFGFYTNMPLIRS